MAKHLVKSSSTTGEPQRPRSVSLLLGMLMAWTIALAAAAGGCSSGGTTELTEAEAKAFLDDFAPEYTRMTIEMFNRALVGHTESAIVSKEHQITDFSVACPGGGTIDFSVESVSVPTAPVNGSTNFVANATSTNCRILVWEIEVVGTLPTTLEVLPDGHQIDSNGTLRVRLPADNREFNLEVRELTATITSAGTCYTAVIILNGPRRIEGGDDTSCHEPAMPDGGIPDGGTGGTGGTGGGGGPALSCDVCGQLDCAEFSDNAFAKPGWDDAKVFANDNSYEVDQLSDDGNPAPYRFVSHTVGMESSIWVAHTKTDDAEYDPRAQGAIDSIHCALDGRALEGSRQASVRALLEQDGRWFWTPFDEGFGLIGENGWDNREWSAASWEAAGHSVPLDLTADGLPITFGFATGASHTIGLEEVTRNTGVDNWRVVICKE
jgi:hypothetical protein